MEVEKPGLWLTYKWFMLKAEVAVMGERCQPSLGAAGQASLVKRQC